jgi:hypothetical protein
MATDSVTDTFAISVKQDNQTGKICRDKKLFKKPKTKTYMVIFP